MNKRKREQLQDAWELEGDATIGTGAGKPVTNTKASDTMIELCEKYGLRYPPPQYQEVPPTIVEEVFRRCKRLSRIATGAGALAAALTAVALIALSVNGVVVVLSVQVTGAVVGLFTTRMLIKREDRKRLKLKAGI
jgi:hypothetical protein